jgi:hypothetical protein
MPSISPAFLKAQGVLRRIPARAIYERWNLCLGRSWHRLPEAPQRDEVYYVASGRAKMMLEFEGKTLSFITPLTTSPRSFPCWCFSPLQRARNPRLLEISEKPFEHGVICVGEATGEVAAEREPHGLPPSATRRGLQGVENVRVDRARLGRSIEWLLTGKDFVPDR